MKICVLCFSDDGAKLAARVCERLGAEDCRVHSTPKYAQAYGFVSHESISADMGALFSENDALVFVGACGIAVREIAPHLKSKTTDPAVVVIDDKGRFVIPLLSGHIGGANALAKAIAERIGAQAIVTTATDGAGKFSCDAWAVKNGCAISSMETAKKISAAILQNDVPICSDYKLPDVLPDGLVHADSGELGIYVGIRDLSPFRTTLRLIPRTLTLGIGCRRGVEKERIAEAVKGVFAAHGLDTRAIGRIASIDAKSGEPGLLAYAEECGITPTFYTAKELNAVEGAFEESAFVKKTVGTGNVCERAAALDGGRIVIKKTAANGVTVAAAEKERRIDF